MNIVTRSSRREFIRRNGLVIATASAFGAMSSLFAAEKEEEEVSPSEDLMREHGVLKRVLLVYGEAIIVNPVDTMATPKMTELVTKAGIPLVYVNLQPAEETLPKGVAYVGSEEIVSGKLQGEAIAKLLNNKGNVVIMMGELATQAAVLRTEGVEKVVAQHPEMKIVGKQTANWRRNEAIDLMNNWLVAGTQIDAVVANNDEMAIGAVLALQQAGKDPKKVVIAGIDATTDALAEMEKGNLDMTVFQDANGQGKGAVETAVKLIKGEKVESFVWIPFELVTPENYKEYLKR